MANTSMWMNNYFICHLHLTAFYFWHLSLAYSFALVPTDIQFSCHWLHVHVYRPFWSDLSFLGAPMAQTPLDLPVWSHPLNLHRQLSLTQMPSLWSAFSRSFSWTLLHPSFQGVYPPYLPDPTAVSFTFNVFIGTPCDSSQWGQAVVQCCDCKSTFHSQPSWQYS